MTFSRIGLYWLGPLLGYLTVSAVFILTGFALGVWWSRETEDQS